MSAYVAQMTMDQAWGLVVPVLFLIGILLVALFARKFIWGLIGHGGVDAN